MRGPVTGRIADSGTTGEGSSKWGAAFHCLQLYSYSKVLQILNVQKTVFDLGSAFHLQFAQRALAIRDGADAWETDQDAIYQAGLEKGFYHRLPVEYESDLWAMCDADAKLTPWWRKIMAVEEPMALEFGPLDCPGHEGHGKPIRYNPRIDLAEEDSKGMVWIDDHKTGAHPTLSLADAYSMDFQFLMMRLIGKTYYGDRFGGVRVHFVQSKPPYKCDIVSLETADRSVPWAAGRIGQRFVQMAHDVAWLETETAAGRLSAWDWPACMRQEVCFHRYGKCDGWQYCAWGPK